MINYGRFKLIGNYITACDYDYLISKIERSIKNRDSLLISPLASQTLVLAFFDKRLKNILDKFNYLAADSQWVRWSLGFLFNIWLKDRVYGPNLMLKISETAKNNNYKIFLYGTTRTTLNKLTNKLANLYGKRIIVGFSPSKFRKLNTPEIINLANIIFKSKANIVFIGVGSPYQEVLSWQLSKQLERLNRYLIIVPTGAAFDFISGTKPQAPQWMQNAGLEWFFRWLNEPIRLFKRYAVYSILYIYLILIQKIRKLFILE